MALKTLTLNLNQLRTPSSEPNNNLRLKPTTRKCLFGAADPQDTYKVLEEQFKVERERFYQRFGIHMEDFENNVVGEEASPRKRKSNEKLKVLGEKVCRSSRVLKPYNVQTKMTDFCQIKKSPLELQKKI